jgi:hypothetical protein
MTKTTEYCNTPRRCYIYCLFARKAFDWRHGENGNARGFWKGNLKERENLEDLALDRMIILKPRIKLITYGNETNKFFL